MTARSQTDPAAEAESDVLRSDRTSGLVVRGGLVRTLGYGATFLLGLATAVFLLRHLGVADFGRFATVMALVTIVGGLSDVGLTAVGSRDLAVRHSVVERERLLGGIVTLRLLITPVGVGLAVLFAVVADYDGTMIAGTAIAGAGIVLINVQAAFLLPLSVELRIGAVTGIEVLKQVVTLVTTIVLVLVGAPLLPFFAIPVAVGVVALAVTPWVVGRHAFRVPVTRDIRELVTLVRITAPVAVAVSLNLVYFRVLIVVVSVVGTAVETGEFATAFRIYEALFVLPALVLATALPVLSVAGVEDRPRLAHALRRMTETGIVAACGLVLAVVVLARPAIEIVGGASYAGAVPVLRVQALSLLFVFVGQAVQLGLLAIHAQRAMAWANGLALGLAIGLGVAAVPIAGAVGVAVAAVAAETVLATALWLLLRREDRRLAPPMTNAWKPLLAAGAGACVLLVPGLGVVLEAVIAAGVFVTLALVLRVVPPEIVEALAHRDRQVAR